MKIRTRLDYFMALLAGEPVDINDITPSSPINSTEELLIKVGEIITSGGGGGGGGPIFINNVIGLIDALNSIRTDTTAAIAEATNGMATKAWTNAQGFLKQHQSLAEYAKKRELPTKTSQLINDSGFLTEHQDLSSYAKKTDLPKKTSQLTNDSGFLTEHQSLEAYAKKAEVPSKTSQLINDSGFLTEHQSLDEYAKLDDIPEVPENVSAFNNDAGYLKEHQSLSDYSTTAEMNTAIQNAIDSIPSDVTPYEAGTAINITDKVISVVASEISYNSLTDKPTIPDDYLVEDDLEPYAKITDLPIVPENVSAFNNDAGYLKEHQDLSDYVKIEDLPVVPSNVSAFANDAGYLTEHQDISGKANVSDLGETAFSNSYEDLDDLPLLPTKLSDLNDDLGNSPIHTHSQYLTEHQDLSEYAKLDDIPEIPTDVSAFVNDAGYLTEHQDISGKANVSDLKQIAFSGSYDDLIDKPTIPGMPDDYLTEKDLQGYAKLEDVPEVPKNVSSFNNDVGYLTEHQDLSDYAKMEDLPTKTSELTNDSGFLTEHQSLEDYPKFEDIPKIPENVSEFKNDVGYLTEHQDLSDYAKLEDIPDVPKNVSEFENDAGYITEHQDLSQYAKIDDIPEIPENVSAFTNDIGYLTEHQDLSEYAKLEDIPEIPENVSAFTNDVGYLTEHQDLSEYAKLEDIPEIPTKLSDFDDDLGSEPVHTHNQYLTEHQDLSDYAKLEDIPTSLSEFEDDLGSTPTHTHSQYLTEHQDLSDYAKVEDIPTIPTSLSEFEDDLGNTPTHTHSQYLTEHQDISGKAERSSVDALSNTVATHEFDIQQHSQDISDLFSEKADKSEINTSVYEATAQASGALESITCSYTDLLSDVNAGKQVFLKVTMNGVENYWRLEEQKINESFNPPDRYFTFYGIGRFGNTGDDLHFWACHVCHKDNINTVGSVTTNDNGTAATDLRGIESRYNKVSSWSATTTDSHYPTEKLTKDTIDALRAYVDDQYGAHVLWQVDANNGLESTETKARTTDWQLENIDMTPYKYVLAYIRACEGINADQEGASLVIRIDLNENMKTPRSGRFVGGTASIYPNDNGVKYMVSAVIDETKTKFAFNYCMANTTGTTALDRDGKCWKLEGFKN